MVEMNDFQKEIWLNNYKAPQDNTIQDTFRRVSKAIASAQTDPNMKELLQENYFKLMCQWKFLPGGRITANAGVDERGKATLYNCYVYNPQDFGIKDIDSMQVIFDTLKKSAKILGSEGGLGINATYLRPNGSFIKGTGARTPGVVKFLQIWDKASQIITMGSTKEVNDGKKAKKKIRKGALMGVLADNHSEIKQFITAKQQSNRLSKFNLSVLVTDKLMNAVVNNEMWDLCFPDTQWQNYKELWDGDLAKWVEKGYPVNITQTLPARQLWDLILRSTYTRNEPGVLFYDTLNDYNPIKYTQTILTTNPCLSGDTLIAVADGRNAVTIEELAQEGKDTPVYCINPKTGETQIKMMRNPRITGYDKEIYEIQLNHQYKVRCTGNHRFATPNGTYKFVQDLKVGDKLYQVDLNLQKDIPSDTSNLYIDQRGRTRKVCQVCGKQFFTYWDCREYSTCCSTCSAILEKRDKEIRYIKPTQKLQVTYISVCGRQKVYNGTVDNYHNFNICLDANEQVYINNLQCGQIGMSSGVCNLGSLNLPAFYKDGKFDYQSFEQAIKYGICFLDGVCDISYVPLKQYEQKIKDFRRVGLGVTGLGSLLSMLGIKFGTQKAIQTVNQIFKFKCQIQLLTSALLGKTKGSFLKFNKDQYFSSKWWYELPISYEIKRQIEKIGCMRNAVHADVPPSGNCLLKNTKIMTEQGVKKISQIFKQNFITKNHKENQWYIPIKTINVMTLNGLKRIIGLYKNHYGKVISIKTKSGKIQGTSQHKVLVKISDTEATWKKIGQLNLGEKILYRIPPTK